MGGLTRLMGKLVALDSPAIIYYVEEKSTFLPLVQPFFEAVRRGEISVVTSYLLTNDDQLKMLSKPSVMMIPELASI